MAERLVPKLIPKREVRYQRGDWWVELDATVGSTILTSTDEYGVRTRTEMRDYLIEPALLIIGGIQVEPAEGDKIIDTGEGKTRTYMVMQGQGEEAWRYTDRYHSLLRIHVKEIEESVL